MSKLKQITLFILLFIVGYYAFEHQEIIKNSINNTKIKDENKIIIILVIAFIIYSLHKLSKNKLLSENFDAETDKINANLKDILLTNKWANKQNFNNGIEVTGTVLTNRVAVTGDVVADKIQTNNLKVNKGISFAQGNLTSNTLIQTGRGRLEDGVNSRNQSGEFKMLRVNFPTPFADTPIITVTCSGADNGCAIPLTATTCDQNNIGFTINFFNIKDDWAIYHPQFNWIAIGTHP
jgi:hypothetical protein